MKLICDKNEFYKLLTLAERNTSKNPTLPALSAVLLKTSKNRLIIISTNLEVGFEGTIPSKIEEEGEVTPPIKTLISVIFSIPEGEIALESKNQNLKIISKTSTTNLKCFSTEDFPLLPKIKKENYLNPEVLGFIAANVQKNIRELEGALNSVVAKSKLSGRILNIPEVKEIIDKNTQPKRIVTANQIIKCVAEFYDINEKILFEKTRKKEVVKPRQIAMYLLREDFSGSYPFIGQRFGGRDHTTAIHSYEKIFNELKKNAQLIEEVKRIRELYDYNYLNK